MTYSIIPDSEALSKCAWCGEKIGEENEVFGIGAKLKPDADLSAFQSHCVEIELVSEDRIVTLLVTQEGSQARVEGQDGVFMVCSKKCARRLTGALEKDIRLGKLFKEVIASTDL